MNVLVTIPAEQHHRELLEKAGAGCDFIYMSGDQVTSEIMERTDILIGNVSIAQLSHGNRLKWVQLNSAGADQFCQEGVLGEEVLLTCATGAYGLAISEWMLTMALMYCKHADRYMKNQQAGIWHDEGRVSSIYGSTTLMIGMGDIGSEFAKRMHLLGSRVIGVRRHAAETPDYAECVVGMEEIDHWLPKADFVALALPNTPDTCHLFDARRMELMKNSAFLINAGRGNAVDCSALNQALRSGVIGGAGLDVTEPEPLPENDPLWSAPNLFLTPHCFGWFNLPETLERIVRIAAENMELFLAGRTDEMKSIVDRTTGYRKL